MARTLPAAISSAVSATVTEPLVLCQIVLGTTTLRYSSRATVSWDGATWSGGSLRVESLASAAGGGMSGNVSLSNVDDAIGTLVLNSDLTESDVRLWLLYGRGPFGAGDALALFRGVIDAADLSAVRVSLALVTEGRRGLMRPGLYVGVPLCNHIPPPGTEYVLAGVSFAPGAQAMTPNPWSATVVVR